MNPLAKCSIPRTHIIMVVVFKLLGVIFAAGLALAGSTCPAGYSNHVCCVSYETFGEEPILGEICGLNVDNSTTIGSLCDPLSTWLVSFE